MGIADISSHMGVCHPPPYMCEKKIPIIYIMLSWKYETMFLIMFLIEV